METPFARPAPQGRPVGSVSSSLLAKIEAALRLAETLRLNALDVEIWLHEVVNELRRGSVQELQAVMAELDLFGLRANSTAEEEYQPEDRDWS